MLNNLINQVKEEFSNKSTTVYTHAEIFQDKLAAQISWEPAKSGGANFKTYKIVKVDEANLEVSPSIMAQIFVHIFMLVGAGMLSFVVYQLFESGWRIAESNLILLGVGVVFSIVSVVLNNLMAQKKYFDKTLGYYWVGKKGPRQVYEPKHDKRFTALESIYALQIIRERVSSDDGSYNSYELNLVCKDKSRVNVMDHGNYDALLEDAQLLSLFLGVPLWDGGNW